MVLQWHHCQNTPLEQFYGTFTISKTNGKPTVSKQLAQIQWHAKVWQPLSICENVSNFNKIREIIQNACLVLS